MHNEIMHEQISFAVDFNQRNVSIDITSSALATFDAK